MASDVDICNLACSFLGEEANIQSISPPDNSVAAEKSAQFYPLARDLVLSEGFSFNTKRAVLAQLSSNPSTVWAYAYGLPDDCMRPLMVYVSGIGDDTNSEDFVTEAQTNGNAVLYTNIPLAELKYTIRVPETGRYTPLVVIAIARCLATFLVGALIKGKTALAAAQAAQMQYTMALNTATSSDAKTAVLRDAISNRKPDHISIRS